MTTPKRPAIDVASSMQGFPIGGHCLRDNLALFCGEKRRYVWNSHVVLCYRVPPAGAGNQARRPECWMQALCIHRLACPAGLQPVNIAGDDILLCPPPRPLPLAIKSCLVLARKAQPGN